MQVCLMTRGFQQSSLTDPDKNNSEAISVLSENRPSPSDVSDIYAQCLVLTSFSGLFRVDLLTMPTGSYRIHWLWNDTSWNLPSPRITCMTYCEDISCICIGDENGVISLYQDLGDHSVTDGSNSDVENISNKGLLAEATHPLENLITLGELTHSVPLDSRTRACFISSNDWAEVNLSDEIIPRSNTEKPARVCQRRRKASVFNPDQTTFGIPTEKVPVFDQAQSPSVTISADVVGDSGECDAVQIISRFVTRQLIASNEKHSRNVDDSSRQYGFHTAVLPIQLALAGGSAARLWESRPQRNRVDSNSIYKSPEIVVPDSECILEISLSRTCSVSHFGLHLCLSDLWVSVDRIGRDIILAGDPNIFIYLMCTTCIYHLFRGILSLFLGLAQPNLQRTICQPQLRFFFEVFKEDFRRIQVRFW